ncbi:hypothetical protein [Phytopseudomonas flavescens]|uniref:hypothetical protein n=1 Tax=Phytopseudomonas flavescens TaxID=29435 RepID=UPI0011143573|nr:hypothetical protein [Pseudomonas flavescens]
MKTNFSLKVVRQAWIDAYFKSDVDWLAHVESPFFFVKRGAIVMSKKEQLSLIERNRRKVPIADTVFNETTTQTQEHTGWATISGSASVTRDNELVNEYKFFELWLILHGRWQIASLCYDDINNNEAEK